MSLPSSAVKYIKRYTRDYSEKRILLVGTGKMGCLVLKHLEAEGFEKVTMCNRTYHNNESTKIPQKFKTIEYHNRYEALPEVDIVISATSSPHTVFRKEKISKIDHEILFIDLALPRDIDREISNIKNVEILGIDDFKSVIQERKTWQLEQIEYIESEIELNVDNLVNWEEHTIVDPILKQINTLVSKKAEETIQILNKRYKFSGKDLKYLEKIIRSEFLRLVKPTILKLKSLNHDEVNLINEAIKILGHKNKEGESNESSFNV